MKNAKWMALKKTSMRRMMIIKLGTLVQENLAFDLPEAASTDRPPVQPQPGALLLQSPAEGLSCSSLQRWVTPTPKPRPGSPEPRAVFFLKLRNLKDTGGNNDPVNRVTAVSCSLASGSPQGHWASCRALVTSLAFLSAGPNFHPPPDPDPTHASLTLSRYRNSAGQ